MIAIVNVSLGFVLPLPDSNSNLYKRTHIYGGFSVQDLYSNYDANGYPSGTI
jgi:hypothetical protein